MSTIPISELGSPMDFDAELAPGVQGYALREGGILLIPWIAATNPGNGDVRRFLDDLPRDETIRFPTVMSPILAGALARRGFIRRRERAPDIGDGGEIVEFWERLRTDLPKTTEGD